MTETQRAAMQKTLGVLEFFKNTAISDADTKIAEEGIAAIRAALAEPEQRKPLSPNLGGTMP